MPLEIVSNLLDYAVGHIGIFLVSNALDVM
jgi:hypothetical protein